MESDFAGVIIGFLLGVVCTILVYDIGDPYGQGQIDALTGNVKYELVSHPDGTKTWESKK